jgi:uncharacterized Zn-binding protein involved in type VI secretion
VGGSIQSRGTIQSGDTTVAVETLNGQSRYTVQSEWRHYTVRVDTLYSHSEDTIETGDTVKCGGSIQSRDTIQSGDTTVTVETIRSE